MMELNKEGAEWTWEQTDIPFHSILLLSYDKEYKRNEIVIHFILCLMPTNNIGIEWNEIWIVNMLILAKKNYLFKNIFA